MKIPLGLWEGSTENATVARALLSDLVDRGLDPEQGIRFVIDGAKALRKAIREVFGDRAPCQRCVRHKERNVVDHLPSETGRSSATACAPLGPSTTRSARRSGSRSRELDRSCPGAAASLGEGLEETVTVQRLGASERLRRTLQSTNPCESMIEIVRKVQRNVQRWRGGDMRLRWTAAGMLEAERQFRRIIGCRDLARLAGRSSARSLPFPYPAQPTPEGRRRARSLPRAATEVQRRAGILVSSVDAALVRSQYGDHLGRYVAAEAPF